MNDDKRFAVLIDADNISDKYIKYIFDELTNDGVITYKRIYGDWTKPSLASWKSILLNHSITPIQQYSYTYGKNATDSAMIIDAMDILYSKNVEGFCLVSSDSDFTRLASRLREAGMYVIGMGEKKTPSAFIAACNKFKYLDVLAQAEEAPRKEEKQQESAPAEPAFKPVCVDCDPVTPLETVRKTILSIVDEITDEDGYCPLSDVGNILNKRFPDFDVRNYGFVKLTPFIRSLKLFDITSINRIIYIRIKK
jgi:uncharacterized LabA/DUF88 family protein